MKKLIVAATAALMFAAHADFKDGNKLYNQITSSNSIDQMVALGYITGVSDSYDGIFFCIVGGVTAGQEVDVVRKHLFQNPELRNQEAIVLVSAAFGAAWPCPTKQKQGGKTL